MPAIFFEHLRHWTMAYLRAAQAPMLPECVGLSVAGYGNRHLKKEDVAENRRIFLRILDRASIYYERTIALLYCAESLDERASGHDLKYWLSGSFAPPAVWVPVSIAEVEGRPTIAPGPEDAKPIVQSGWRVPQYPVWRAALTTVAPERVRRSSPPPAEPARTELPAATKKGPATPIEIVGGALSLAQRLDDSPRIKAPTHLTVLHLYCSEQKSLREIARVCRCSHATVVNRKRHLESQLGLPLDHFRAHSGLIDRMRSDLEDARARRIHPALQTGSR